MARTLKEKCGAWGSCSENENVCLKCTNVLVFDHGHIAIVVLLTSILSDL